MHKGFVFGKFLPFHKGHQAMIDFAFTKCSFLTVLVCCSDKESIPCEVRRSWIAKTYEGVKHIEVKAFNYQESELPNSSESSLAISKVWSEIFKDLFPDYQLVVTSEPYGEYVASFLGIQHIPFDTQKKLFPTSATAIREDLFANWNFLPNAVKPYFAIKVVLLGTESTGKTTLTERLAKHFHCTWVLEAGRELIPDSKEFKFEDLLSVATEHATRIEKATMGQSPLVIIDTDIHITKSYAHFIFNQELEVSKAVYDVNKADLYLYLHHDAEFIQDGTRLEIAERNKLDESHRAMLKKHKIEFVEITGTFDQRFEKATTLIDVLIKGRTKKYRT